MGKEKKIQRGRQGNEKDEIKAADMQRKVNENVGHYDDENTFVIDRCSRVLVKQRHLKVLR